MNPAIMMIPPMPVPAPATSSSTADSDSPTQVAGRRQKDFVTIDLRRTRPIAAPVFPYESPLILVRDEASWRWTEWYRNHMSGTFTVTVGNKGRIVVPAEVRERRSWREGTPLVGIETAAGLVLVGRDDARRLLRDQLAGHDLVADLIATRRAEAVHDAA